MNYPPLTRWKCDHCGEMIESAEDGYVVWEDSASGDAGFEIIHHGRCDKSGKSNSGALRNVLGSDGLAKLTSHLSYGILKEGFGQPMIADMDGFVDFFRRVQLPYYEEARTGLLSEQEEWSDANEVRPYLQDVLQRIAKG